MTSSEHLRCQKAKITLNYSWNLSVLGRKDLRKLQISAFLFQDLDAPTSRVRSTAENQNKALHERSFDLQLNRELTIHIKPKI